MRPAYLVPETLSADDLFRDMQHKKVHLAVVIDEYGELAGVVSLEDLLEEIVGNIYDEFDPAEPPELEHLEDGSVVLRDIGLYTQTTGLTLEPSGGNALFIG